MQQPQPVYSLTGGLTNNNVKKAVQTVFDSGIHLGEYLPQEILEGNQLASYEWALKQIHFPIDFDHLLRARKRLVYDEFFFFLLELGRNRLDEAPEENRHPITETAQMEDVKERLPFDLTPGQKQALADILGDLSAPLVSQRLRSWQDSTKKSLSDSAGSMRCPTLWYV